jgi:hypothetical protein
MNPFDSSLGRPAGLLFRWLPIVAALLIAAGCGDSGNGMSSGSLTVSIGTGGRVQVGEWTPIVVRSTAPVADKLHPEVIAPDPDGLPVRFVLPELTTEGSSGEFLIGQVDSPIRVELHSAEKPGRPVQAVTLTTLNSDLRFLRPDVRFWGVFSDDAFLKASLEKFVAELSAAGSGQGSAAHSPVEVRALARVNSPDPDGLDALFINASTLRQLSYAPGEAGDLLRQWLSRGGQLLVIARGEPEDFSADEIVSWFPIKVDTDASLRFRDLQILSKGINRGLLRTPRAGVAGVKMSTAVGRSLSTGLEGDLLMRAPYGRGGVTMLAVDVQVPPLEDWDGLPAFLGGLADFVPTRETLKQRTDLNPTGISDLQTQLLRTTNDFPAIRRPSYWGALGLILLAFAVVGPLDYLLVHYVLRRPHWTWFTLAAWIGLLTFGGVAYARSVTGTTELANQLDLLDVDETLGRIGARTWYTLYGPEARRIDLSIAPAAGVPVKDVTVSDIRWAGRPEAGFRGMHRPGGLSTGEPGYTIEPAAAGVPPRLAGYPLRPGSTCDIQGEWEGTLSAPLVRSRLQGDTKSRFLGTFTSDIPGSVSEWFIAYGTFAFYAPLEARGYPIMTLKPGTTVNVKELQARRLDDFLSGIVTTTRYRDSRKKEEEYAFTRAPYDNVGMDPYAIFKAVSFYKAVGGQGYVQLANGPVFPLDRSSVVQNGHAVLFGRIETPVSSVSVENARPAPTAQSFLRVVLPVEQIAVDFSFPKLTN